MSAAESKPDPVEVAQAAFVAGLLHGTVAGGGWHVHEAAPVDGRFTVGCAALFGPGVVADVTITVRQMEPPA